MKCSYFCEFSINIGFSLIFSAKALIVDSKSAQPLQASNRLEYLDDYSLLGIFDYLHFDDLLNLAELNARFQELILSHCIIPHHFTDHRILILVDWTIVELIDPITNTKYATDFTKTLRILRAFGSGIDSLSVRFVSYTSSDSKRISQQVNAYCADAVKEIVLYNIGDGILNDWKNSFTEARSVILRGFELGKDFTINLNEIFPQMQRFELTSHDQTNLLFLDKHFPHLQYFAFYTFHDQQNDVYIRSFIQLNQQIRGLQLGGIGDFEFLRYLNRLLPQLEDLGLENRMSNLINLNENGILRFENVKNFKLTLSHDQAFDRNGPKQVPCIEFSRLESFELVSTIYASIDELFEFILRNRALSNVAIAHSELSIEQVIHLVRQLPKLNNLTVELKRRAIGNEMREFLLNTQNHQVGKITISINKNGIDRDDVMSIFPNTWTFSGERSFGFRRFLSFTRAYITNNIN